LVGRLLVGHDDHDGVRVLDAFCHTGGFGLAALAAGAAAVTFLDSAETAVGTAVDNAVRNGWSARCQPLCANAFDVLRSMARQEQTFSAVVLDPPAFAHGRAQLDSAYRGYKEINLRAMRILAPGGLLCTCSCSQPVGLEMFLEMLADAAADAGRRLRVLAVRGAPPDHPGLLGAGETQYLKCVLAQAVD
jgi:23S rRNA (cytosine1962-C5)-methyltransferase